MVLCDMFPHDNIITKPQAAGVHGSGVLSSLQTPIGAYSIPTSTMRHMWTGSTPSTSVEISASSCKSPRPPTSVDLIDSNLSTRFMTRSALHGNAIPRAHGAALCDGDGPCGSVSGRAAPISRGRAPPYGLIPYRHGVVGGSLTRDNTIVQTALVQSCGGVRFGTAGRIHRRLFVSHQIRRPIAMKLRCDLRWC